MIESRILLALFNGAWQSGLVCLVAFVALRRARKLNATNVHGIWNVLLCISVALPFANFALTKPAYTVTAQMHATHVAQAAPSANARLSAKPQMLARSAPAIPVTTAAVRVDAAHIWFNAELYALRHARSVLFAMVLLALAKLAFLIRDLVVMFRLRRRARPVSVAFNVRSQTRRTYTIASTDELRSPCVLGFAKPLVVVPGALLDTEHEERLRDVLLHEVAHIARWDDVQNFLHRAIAAILFFDPGVMLALHELAAAREAACDDAVLDARKDRVAYATTLSGMAMWVRRHSIAVPSLVFGKKQLLRRVEQLLDRSRNHSLRENRPLTVTTLVALALAGYALVHIQVPAVAQTVASLQKHLGLSAHKLTAAPHPSYNARLLAAAAPAAEAATPKPTARPVERSQKIQITKKAEIKKTVAPPAPDNAPIAVPNEDSAIAANPPRVAAYAPKAKTDLLDALDAGGYRNLSPDDLIKLTSHGVNACLIEAAGQTFAHRPNVDELVSMADNGVSCTYIRALAWYGLRGLQPAQLVHLAQQGVSVPFAAAAIRNVSGISVDDIARLSQHGISGAYLDGLRSMRYSVTADQAVKLADHGVSLRTIQRLNHLRTTPLSVDDLVRLVDAGVTGE